MARIELASLPPIFPVTKHFGKFTMATNPSILLVHQFDGICQHIHI